MKGRRIIFYILPDADLSLSCACISWQDETVRHIMFYFDNSIPDNQVIAGKFNTKGIVHHCHKVNFY